MKQFVIATSLPFLVLVGSSCATSNNSQASLTCARPCDADAQCVTTGDAPTCRCNDGFEGDGTTCADIDECAADASACGTHGTCKNTRGSFTCTCDDGFEGDGKTCADIDECTTSANDCGRLATCTNSDGGFSCACNVGYQGDGKTCTDIDECATAANDCNRLATCTNSDGGFLCTCRAGYQGDGRTCEDVDECAAGTDNCNSNSTCSNAEGSFTCTCHDGFTSTSNGCGDINECTTGASNCSPLAACTNVPGSFSCACLPGYTGDGISCRGADEFLINAGADTTASQDVTLYLQEPGNLLVNPGGETNDLSGWTLTPCGSGWVAGAPVLFGAHGFIMSYCEESRSQEVDLLARGLTAAQLDAAPPITVREWYLGAGPNYADDYYLRVELRDASHVALATYNTALTASIDRQQAGRTFTGYPPGVRYVYFEDGGNDAEFWLGSYGTLVDAASVVVGVVQMRFSNDGVTWSDWAPFTPTTSWTLEAAAGLKTVYAELQDASGAVTAVSDTITLH